MEIAHDDHAPNTMRFIQPHTYFETDQFGSPCGHHDGGFDHQEQHKTAIFFEEGSSSEKSTGVATINVAAAEATAAAAMSSSSSLSSPRSTNNSEVLGLGYPSAVKKYGSPEEGPSSSVISFKGGYDGNNFAQAAAAGGSVLSFDQNDQRFSQDSFSKMMIISNQVDHDDYSIWEDNSHYNYQNQMLLQSSNNISTSASPSSEVTLGWLSSEPNADANMNCNIQVLGRPEPSLLSKRLYGGESTQAPKKQCTAVTKMPNSKSKDPQSIAAKNRRERISERLKILQDLVPNGSKVDLVTMLEKAISYVKFLQLQVKVLATDEFWPAQGGKAPDLSQVREAIDAILASQRDRNSSSYK